MSGRGPLAGPVVCAAVYIPDSVDVGDIVLDSKMISEKQRINTYEKMTSNPYISWEVSVVTHSEIDEINILQASLVGMRRAAEKLLENAPLIERSKCIALVDGNKIPLEMPVPTTCIIGGDSSVFSIAAASIVAKVTRDRIMIELDAEYPHYNFAKHKGYPTSEHKAGKYIYDT